MLEILSKVNSRWARMRLERHGGIEIAHDAKIQARRVMLKPGCTLQIGARSIVEAAIDFERDGAEIVIGENCYVGASTLRCAGRIEIGTNVEIAWNCSIVDHDWESLVFEQRHVDMRGWYTAKKDWKHVPIRPVRICDRALIGFNAVILKGVTVGEGAVVGVGSIVTKDVAPYTVVAGAPARVVRKLETNGRSSIAAQTSLEAASLARPHA